MADCLTHFYLVGGLSSYYIGEKSYYSSEKYEVKWRNDFYLNIGAGIGMEFHFTKHIGLAIEAPLSATFGVSKNGFKFIHAWPIPNIALTYYF